MKIDKTTTLVQFSGYFNVLSGEHINDLFERLKTREKPKEIAGKTIPDNLFLISWSQFATLQSANNAEDAFFAPFEIILGSKKENLVDEKIFDIIGFLIFVKKELENIAKLFDKIRYSPTPEEKQAGIDKLNFGLFGTLDWYARRMGFADHLEAEKMPLVRIYKCLEIDHSTAKFEKRLRKIYENKNKIKK